MSIVNTNYLCKFLLFHIFSNSTAMNTMEDSNSVKNSSDIVSASVLNMGWRKGMYIVAICMAKVRVKAPISGLFDNNP